MLLYTTDDEAFSSNTGVGKSSVAAGLSLALSMATTKVCYQLGIESVSSLQL